MNAIQQHMLDAYRATQHGEAAPILPGAGDVRAVREIRMWRRFKTVITDPEDRPLTRFLRTVRHALTRSFGTGARTGGPAGAPSGSGGAPAHGPSGRAANRPAARGTRRVGAVSEQGEAVMGRSAEAAGARGLSECRD
ncbi:hypothetical protein [Streptomyces sp. NPDC003077]|uniref:hypothetical protein n=1 Tax=Streptomyces sp. NPDC003077 TaxID=3154443 RepID=UPI0033AD8E89